MDIVTFGDVALDVIVALDGPLRAGDDRSAGTHVGAGGQAANVAAWAAALGAASRVVYKRGADGAAALLERELASLGVLLAGPRGGRSAVVVSLSGGGERSLASDRGSSPELRPDELEADWFHCRSLHISGYALVREPQAAAARRAAALARGNGARVSLDLSSVGLIDEPFRRRVRALEPELVFATEREWERFGSLDTRAVVKRGADGVRVDGSDHPAAATSALDTTGAGDALAAGYLIGGVTLGLEAAARCCARLGSLP